MLYGREPTSPAVPRTVCGSPLHDVLNGFAGICSRGDASKCHLKKPLKAVGRVRPSFRSLGNINGKLDMTTGGSPCPIRSEPAIDRCREIPGVDEPAQTAVGFRHRLQFRSLIQQWIEPVLDHGNVHVAVRLPQVFADSAVLDQLADGELEFDGLGGKPDTGLSITIEFEHDASEAVLGCRRFPIPLRLVQCDESFADIAIIAAEINKPAASYCSLFYGDPSIPGITRVLPGIRRVLHVVAPVNTNPVCDAHVGRASMSPAVLGR